MKKLLFLLLLIGCEKDATFCWKCRRDVFSTTGHYSVVIQVCGMSESQKISFEQSNTVISGTTTTSMKCWKEGEQPPL